MTISTSLKRLALPLALAFSLALCLPHAAHADDASRHAKAGQLVLLLHSDHMVQQAVDGIMKQVSDAAQSVAGDNPTPQNKAKLDDFTGKVSQLLDAQLGWKALEPTLTDLYAKTFTEDQLDTYLVFYKSPAGIALVQNIPAIDAQISEIAHSKMTALQPQLNQMFADFRQGLLAPTAAPASQAPAPAASAPVPPTVSSPK